MALKRSMNLTADLVARVHRIVPDTGPSGSFVHMEEEDYERLTDEVLKDHPPHEDLRIFAYGSLMWRPACEIDGQEMALLRGWHRKFLHPHLALARDTRQSRIDDGAGPRRLLPRRGPAAAGPNREREARPAVAPRADLQEPSDQSPALDHG
jgi:hypothetical protein